jgi:hypothetical protein
MTARVLLLDTGWMDETRACAGARTKVLTLEIDANSDPIAGRLSEDGESAERFFGWLGLARALERTLEHAKPPPSP